MRLNAAHALGTVGGSGQSAGALAETLGREEDEWVRRYAALSMLRLGQAATDAVPQLKQAALSDPNRYVQVKSLEAKLQKAQGEIETLKDSAPQSATGARSDDTDVRRRRFRLCAPLPHLLTPAR